MTPADPQRAPRVSDECVAHLCMEGSKFPWRASAVRTRDDGHRVLDVLSADGFGVAYVFYDDHRPDEDRSCRRNQQIIAAAPDLALDLRDARARIETLEAENARLTAALALAERKGWITGRDAADAVVAARSKECYKQRESLSNKMHPMAWQYYSGASTLLCEAKYDVRALAPPAVSKGERDG